jgi:diguanylate cyclase (GGDEF)-like protein
MPVRHPRSLPLRPQRPVASGALRLGRTLRGMHRRDTAGATSTAPARLKPSTAETDASALRLSLVTAALTHLSQGVSVFDSDDRLVVMNPRCVALWGLPIRLARPGTTLADVLQHQRDAKRIALPVTGSETDAPAGARRELWQHTEGTVIEVDISRLPTGARVALHRDITAQWQAEQRLAHLACHDVLTNLYNRSALETEVATHLSNAPAGSEQALLTLDLDRFKYVNDTLGHGAGDRLLTQVAERLRDCVRDSDVVVRMGGDEFAILQCNAPQPLGATSLARRLIDTLCAPFHLDGHPVVIGASVGVAIAPWDGETAEVLLQHADLALYRAKAEGGNQLRFFEPHMDTGQQQRLLLEADLRGALERGEFELAYQLQVAVPGHVYTGAEALIRWNHPTRGRVSPVDFIPLAEETGLIVAIGRWVLLQACRDAAAWPSSMRVSVNASPLQFKSRTLVQDVFDALRDTGLAADRLVLEITETVLMHDTAHSLSLLNTLRERGVRIAMDDFGTGYSSLGYLRRFPFDKIKIDRSFVRDIENSPDAQAIVRAVTGLGRSLGMATIVEGVETAAQLAAVCAEGCDEVQGFLFSVPSPVEQILPLLKRGRSLPICGGLSAACAGCVGQAPMAEARAA